LWWNPVVSWCEDLTCSSEFSMWVYFVDNSHEICMRNTELYAWCFQITAWEYVLSVVCQNLLHVAWIRRRVVSEWTLLEYVTCPIWATGRCNWETKYQVVHCSLRIRKLKIVATSLWPKLWHCDLWRYKVLCVLCTEFTKWTCNGRVMSVCVFYFRKYWTDSD
jgi:hypothetical protein